MMSNGCYLRRCGYRRLCDTHPKTWRQNQRQDLNISSVSKAPLVRLPSRLDTALLSRRSQNKSSHTYYYKIVN